MRAETKLTKTHMDRVLTQRPLGRCHPITQALRITSTALVLLLSFPLISASAGMDAEAIVVHGNTARSAGGLSPLTPDALLSIAAQTRAEELVVGEYFGHHRPDGRSFAAAVSDVRYPYLHVAENLAMDFFDSSAVIRAWSGSTDHRRNLFGRAYTHVGVGVASGIVHGVPTTIVVQLVAVPLPSEADRRAPSAGFQPG